MNLGSKAFMNGTLGIFSGLCFLGLLFTLPLPETKGLSLEEISSMGDEFLFKPATDVEKRQAARDDAFESSTIA